MNPNKKTNLCKGQYLYYPSYGICIVEARICGIYGLFRYKVRELETNEIRYIEYERFEHIETNEKTLVQMLRKLKLERIT